MNHYRVMLATHAFAGVMDTRASDRMYDTLPLYHTAGGLVATVAAGWGVWGLASAQLVQAASGTALMVAAAPMKVLRPSLRWSRIRPLLGFGVRFHGPLATPLRIEVSRSPEGTRIVFATTPIF